MLDLAVAGLSYGGAYTVLASIFLISHQERMRIRGMLRRIAGMAR